MSAPNAHYTRHTHVKVTTTKYCSRYSSDFYLAPMGGAPPGVGVPGKERGHKKLRQQKCIPRPGPARADALRPWQRRQKSTLIYQSSHSSLRPCGYMAGLWLAWRPTRCKPAGIEGVCCGRGRGPCHCRCSLLSF